MAPRTTTKWVRIGNCKLTCQQKTDCKECHFYVQLILPIVKIRYISTAVSFLCVIFLPFLWVTKGVVWKEKSNIN